MAKARVPDEQERRILRDNEIDPDRFSVVFRDEDTIVLLNPKTRDTLTVRKGDREW